MEPPDPLLPGVIVDERGHATVDASLAPVLCDLAIELQDTVRLPVDVEHVLGAILLAVQSGDLARDTRLSTGDPVLRAVLAKHVGAIFREHGGHTSSEE